MPDRALAPADAAVAEGDHAPVVALEEHLRRAAVATRVVRVVVAAAAAAAIVAGTRFGREQREPA